MKTKVVNLKKEKYGVYIGRGSDFGNPFKIGEDGTREEVIEKFHWYFHGRLARDSKFENKVLALKGKRLGCYCKPFPCHGDEIVKFLEK